jgi:hypothetical protein
MRGRSDYALLHLPSLDSEIILCPWIACVSRCALIPSCPRYLPVAPTSQTMPRVGLVRLKVRLCQGTDRPKHSDDEQNDAHDRLSWLFQLLIRGLRYFDTNALCILSIINKAIKRLRSKEFTKRVSFPADFSLSKDASSRPRRCVCLRNGRASANQRTAIRSIAGLV